MLLLLLSSFTVLVACESQDSCFQKQQEDMKFSLLQARLSLQAETETEREREREAALPTLEPIGRSYYSSAPDESANFVHRYLNAYPEANGDMFVSAPSAKTAGTYSKGWRTVYIQGHDPVMDSIAKEVGQTWNAMMTSQSWNAWGDFHDGTFFLFNLTNAMADNLTNWVYVNYTVEDGTFARFYLPGTSYTHEARDAGKEMAHLGESGTALECQDRDDQWLKWHGSSWSVYGGEADLQEACDPLAIPYLDEQTWEIPEPGRTHVPVVEHAPPTNLFKLTYAVVNASAARDFAKEVLGNTDRESALPYPPTENEDGTTGNGAYWMYVNNDWLQMHFVESGDKAEHARISDFHQLGKSKAEHLRSGCLHAFFLNNMNFRVTTLDPFIEKLEERQVPYLATKNNNGEYALLFAFPGNEAVVIQLSSQHLTKVAPRPPSQLHQNC